MILEAAKRSAGASSPLSYINKLLSEWKRSGVKDIASIPEKTTQPVQTRRTEYKSEATIAADLRGEREHYYAVLRQKAQERAEQNRRRAESDPAFKEADAACKRGEIELARAEVFSPETAERLRRELLLQEERRRQALLHLSLTEADLQPKYACGKCSDTGFLPDGRACDCYPANK